MKYLAGLLLCAFCALAHAITHDAINGTVTAVHDGDTLTIVGGNVTTKVRVFRIDAPEMPYTWLGKHVPEQPYAAKSRDNLKALCLGKPATVLPKAMSGARVVGGLICNGVDVGEWSIKTGNAWVYRYSSLVKLRAMQAKAKSSGAGLWADNKAIEPYLWRNGAR